MATVSRERLRGRGKDHETAVVGRPWRLAPPRPRRMERPLWQVVGLLYAGIILLAALVMTLAFLVARVLA
jgi:hypothetical protein